MNKDEAFIRGANAFHKGESRNPLSDPQFHPFTNPSTAKLYLMKAQKRHELLKSWLKGWDAANLEYVEYDILEHEAAAKAEQKNEEILAHGRFRLEPHEEEAHARWMEDLEYKAQLKKIKETVKPQEGVKFNEDGSVTLSAQWIMDNAEKE